MKKQFLLFAALACCILMSGCQSHAPENSDNAFNWDNASVYFVYIDRFFNANPDNDHNYDRKNDYQEKHKNVATFHGGDIEGLTVKLQEGYFQKLGIDVIWITGVYEQIHGWIAGGKTNDFPHYAYHGYYPMDFTAMDKNYGTIEELRTFVNLAHKQNIRVMMDAGINHPGYYTLLDGIQYGVGDVKLSTHEAREHIGGFSWKTAPNAEKYKVYSYAKDYNSSQHQMWSNWWSTQWVRPNEFCNKDVLTESIYGLPDFRTEDTTSVAMAPFMRRKWEMEKIGFEAWTNPSALPYRQDREMDPADYIIAWLAAWVEEFGLDGFRCDVLDNVEVERWAQLKKACNTSLSTWRKNHPEEAASQWTNEFWMTGDIWGTDTRYYPNYAKAGFNSIVNFTFPKNGDLDTIGQVWQQYADSLNSKNNWTTLSFLNNTYKRDTKFDNIYNVATTFVLSPGAIQVFFGDEVARKEFKTCASDPTHGYRSDYDWNAPNEALFTHWEKLLHFRKNHPSVGAGTQKTIAPNTFVRHYQEDTTIIKLTNDTLTTINVRNIFNNNTTLRNAYTGETVQVIDHQVSFHPTHSLVVIEQVKE